MYKPHVQNLYDYLLIRVKNDIIAMNNQRNEDGHQPLSVSEGQLHEITQDVLNYVTDTEEFQEEVTSMILEKLEQKESTDKPKHY